MVSLYWDLNLLESVLKRPSSALCVSFSAVVRVSKYCTPCLPNYFLTRVNLSICGVLYVERIVLTSNQNVFSSLYLSCTFKSNIGCFMEGPPTLGPDLSYVHSAQASAIVCNGILSYLSHCFCNYFTHDMFKCHDFFVYFSVTSLPNYYFCS